MYLGQTRKIAFSFRTRINLDETKDKVILENSYPDIPLHRWQIKIMNV